MALGLWLFLYGQTWVCAKHTFVGWVAAAVAGTGKLARGDLVYKISKPGIAICFPLLFFQCFALVLLWSSTFWGARVNISVSPLWLFDPGIVWAEWLLHYDEGTSWATIAVCYYDTECSESTKPTDVWAGSADKSGLWQRCRCWFWWRWRDPAAPVDAGYGSHVRSGPAICHATNRYARKDVSVYYCWF